MSAPILSPVIHRLQLFIDNKGCTVSSFAEKCDISKSNLSQTLGGRNKSITDVFINKVKTAYPSLNLTWLLTGHGDMEEVSNIKISEPQNASQTVGNRQYSIDDQAYSHQSSNTGEQTSLFENQETAANADATNPDMSAERFIFPKADAQTIDNQSAQTMGGGIQSHQEGRPERTIRKIILLYSDNTFDYYTPV